MRADTVSVETVFASAPVGLALLAPDSRLRLANPAFCDLLRLAPEAIGSVFTANQRRRGVALFRTPLPDGWCVMTAVEQAEQPDTPGDYATTALSALQTGLAIFGADHLLLFANGRFGELLRLPAESVRPGTPMAELLGETCSGRDTGPAACCLLGRCSPQRNRWRKPDGRTLKIDCDSLADGGCIVLVSDITCQAKAEEGARDRAALLDMILLNVPHGICVYGPDHRVTMFNDTYNKVMAGAPLQVGDSLEDVIRRRAAAHEYGEGEPAQVFAEQIAHDISKPQIRRRVRPNGAAIDIRTAPLPDGGHISVVTDITALVQAEDALRRSAEAMTTMLGSIRHGIVLWGADRRLIASNPIAAELLGLPPGFLTPGTAEDDVIDTLMSLGELGGSGMAADRARRLRSVDRSRPFIREIRTRSGRILSAQSTPAPEGGWVTTYTDVTPIREAESALRAAKDMAEAANRAKSRFLAAVSHELRTPLNAIIGFSDLLIREKGSAPRSDIVDHAREINQAGQQLLSMIDMILNVARLESGRFDTRQEKTDILSAIRSACRHSENAAQAGEVTLQLDLPDSLPPVLGDERQLFQALLQIVGNGVKFTPAGGTVVVSAGVTADDGLHITVSDTGIGIESSKLHQVFEPFVQLDDRLSRRYPGAGLGLFMARAVVAAHDGSLTLESAVGTGTTVRIVLPASRLLTPGPPVLTPVPG